MLTALKAKVGSENPTLAAKMAEVEETKAAGGDVGKLFDGTFIKMILEFAKNNPMILAWVLAMFGIVLPPMPVAE